MEKRCNLFLSFALYLLGLYFVFVKKYGILKGTEILRKHEGFLPYDKANP